MKKDYDENTSAQNKYGEWVPAIIEPYFVGWGLKKAQCWTCAEKPIFKTREQYRGHYALKHILGL